MSWSVSASGTKAAVHAAIDAAVSGQRQQNYSVEQKYPSDQILEFERVNKALHSLVDSVRDSHTHCSLSASGSYDSASVSISGWKEEPKQDETGQPTIQ